MSQTTEEQEDKIVSLLDKREKKKTIRTKKKEPAKKVKKITKKEQQILDITDALEVPDNYMLINTEETLDEMISKYKVYKKMNPNPNTFIDTETYGLSSFKDEIISISIGFNDDTFYNIPLRPFLHERSKDISVLPMDYTIGKLKPLLENDYDIVMANAN